MTKKYLLLGLVFALLILPAFNLRAQELNAEVVEQQINSYDLEGIEIKQIEKAPSALGLWWRGIKESVSLALTFDPVKKAEKLLKYSEERMQIAEKIAEEFEQSGEIKQGENFKNQERVQKNIEKAQKFMEKVETQKDDWMQDENQEKVQRLIKNVATHQIRKEVIFDKIEEKIPEEKLENIIELRDKGLENSKFLINAINNENISEDIRGHLEYVKEKIETHIIEIKEYKEIKGQLQKRVEKGEEGIEYELDELNQKRREKVQEHLQDVKSLILPSLQEIKSGVTAPIVNQEKNSVQNKVQNQGENIMGGQKEELQEQNQAGKINPPKVELEEKQLEKSKDFLYKMIEQD